MLTSGASGLGVTERDIRIARAILTAAMKDQALRESAPAYSAIAFKLMDVQQIKAARDQKAALESAIAAAKSARSFPAPELSGAEHDQVVEVLVGVRSTQA